MKHLLIGFRDREKCGGKNMNKKYLGTDEQIQNWIAFKKESIVKTNNAKRAKFSKI